MGTFGSCALCGKEMFETDRRYGQVVGWLEVKRGRVAAGSLKARHETGAFAHSGCVEDRNSKLKRGIPVKQMGLF